MSGRCLCGVVCLLVGAFAWPGSAADGVWIDVGIRGKVSIPQGHRLVALERGRLEALLDLVPQQGAGEDAPRPVIELPLPDGSYGRFRVEVSGVMAPGLAVRYPEIRTFSATGIDDPTAAARFDLNPKGFHGMILSAGETVFINPAGCDGCGLYTSFGRTAAVPSADATVGCSVKAEGRPRQPRTAAMASGPVLRTYRTAIAATGEYTRYHGGRKVDALAAIVVVMNRMNGIFRRELSVEFELVADTGRVIFTDPETDPYTHDDTAVLILENQAILDRRIGTDNYDHGHLFNTHPGGRAGDFGTTCRTVSKGQGVSGLGVPEGEVFMVDLVAHEMGHQLGAAHTYNSLEHVCSIARNEWAAYEPGSGSTIMSYAGVCRSENITAHSDDYFHSFSLDEIGAHLSGVGGTCGSVTETGNDPPVVEAGPEFTIPAKTPFVLDGIGSDDSPLTFSWEQFDLGPPSPPMEDDGSRPIFRSHAPSAESWRVLPPMADLIDGVSSIGEALPTTSRELTFRLTARDGLGGVGHDTTALQVDGTAGPFEVTAPSSGDRWIAGETATVLWDVAGTDTEPIACDAVDILLSIDDGATYGWILAESTPNDGFEEIEVPLTYCDDARVMAACSESVFFAVSGRFSVRWSQNRQSGDRVTPP